MRGTRRNPLTLNPRTDSIPLSVSHCASVRVGRLFPRSSSLAAVVVAVVSPRASIKVNVRAHRFGALSNFIVRHDARAWSARRVPIAHGRTGWFFSLLLAGPCESSGGRVLSGWWASSLVVATSWRVRARPVVVVAPLKRVSLCLITLNRASALTSPSPTPTSSFVYWLHRENYCGSCTQRSGLLLLPERDRSRVSDRAEHELEPSRSRDRLTAGMRMFFRPRFLSNVAQLRAKKRLSLAAVTRR